MAETITIKIDIYVQTPHETIALGTVQKALIEAIGLQLRTAYGLDATIDGRVTVAKEKRHG